MTQSDVFAKSAALAALRITGINDTARSSTALSALRANTAAATASLADAMKEFAFLDTADAKQLSDRVSAFLADEEAEVAKEEQHLALSALDCVVATNSGWPAIKISQDSGGSAAGGSRKVVAWLPRRESFPFSFTGANTYQSGVAAVHFSEPRDVAACSLIRLRGSQPLREKLLPLLDLALVSGAEVSVRSTAASAFSVALSEVAQFGPLQVQEVGQATLTRLPSSWALRLCTRFALLCFPFGRIADAVYSQGGVMRRISRAIADDDEVARLMMELTNGLGVGVQPESPPWSEDGFSRKLLGVLLDWYCLSIARQFKESIIDPALCILRKRGKLDSRGAFRAGLAKTNKAGGEERGGGAAAPVGPGAAEIESSGEEA